VLDGDTVVVAFADGSTDTVRIFGVDTPNVAQHHSCTLGARSRGAEDHHPPSASVQRDRVVGKQCAVITPGVTRTLERTDEIFP
jgi:hypothetical protein